MAGAGAPAGPQAARPGFDVIVVGAGIMGSCTAHAAASRGSRVLLLERFDLLHPLGSSHGDSRIIRDAYAQPRYLRMVRLARRLWAAAEAEAGYRVLTPTPHLSMGPRASAALAAAVANIGAEEVVAYDLGSRWGGAFAFTVPDPSDGWVTALSDHGGVLSATKAVAMFQSLAVAKGAVVRDNTEVVGIDKAPEGGVVVRASGGEAYHGAKCVVTVGAWAAKLLGSVSGVDLPITPLHTLHLYWRVKPGQEQSLSASAGFPTFSSYGDPPVYGTPSLEVPGLIKISCDGGPPCDPDSRDWLAGDAEVTDRVARWIQEAMPGHVDAAGGPVVRQSCMCAMTPDADFVMDFLGGELGRDVVVGVGFSGHGFKMGPAVGRILAEMAIDGDSKTAAEAGVDLGFFRIGRFDGNPMGNAKKD